jgi:hypothetical protein
MKEKRPINWPILIVGGAIVLVTSAIAVWIMKTSHDARVKGRAACVAKGHDEAFCDEAASKHHERCYELTYDRGTKMRAGSGLDEKAYVDCLERGPEALWGRKPPPGR